VTKKFQTIFYWLQRLAVQFQGDSWVVVWMFDFIFWSKSPKNILLSFKRQKWTQLLKGTRMASDLSDRSSLIFFFLEQYAIYRYVCIDCVIMNIWSSKQLRLIKLDKNDCIINQRCITDCHSTVMYSRFRGTRLLSNLTITFYVVWLHTKLYRIMKIKKIKKW